jgi:prenyltransferase beta subunit
MKEELQKRFNTLCSLLLKERNEQGFWEGMLSSSALSTAVAIVALKINGSEDDEQRIADGLRWLCSNINSDGGFGDTPGSESNVSTSLLSYAAVYYCRTSRLEDVILGNIREFLETRKISLGDDDIASSILAFYGKDYTFSVPILSMLIICGVLSRESVKHIPQLPFELSLMPASWYRFFNLQVVSYAIPALIGVGIYTHTQRNGLFRLSRVYRNKCIAPCINKLVTLMPESGGFLEAIPLTGFVSMCLIASGNNSNTVVEKGLSFLRIQQRKDGSWPIDTDLSTWVTTLSVKSLGTHLKKVLYENELSLLRNYLLTLQFKTIHPFNGAKPGGWGWTSYTGSVPDADDTSGAILALLEMYAGSKEERTTIENGCRWLINLQNKDGGFPTFCKGWGKLPFDRSCADLTGHALLALLKTAEILHQTISLALMPKINSCINRAMDYLARHQSGHGAWLPLWFGNQYTNDKTNPVYGTAKVGVYLGDCLTLQHPEPELMQRLAQMVHKAQNYLLTQQNDDGSWGGKKGIPGTIEETSLAISALAADHTEVCGKGIEWIEKQEKLTPAPIGLYFAMLWYDEKMYPLIYYTEALRRFLEHYFVKPIMKDDL